MKIMVKMYYFVGLIFVMTLVFSGCAKDDADRNDPATLRVLNYFDTTLPGSAEEAARVWDAFEEANPHITIVREDLYGESYHDRIAACIEERQFPDIIFAWPSGRSASLHTGKILKDLSPLAARDKLGTVFSPAALDGGAQAAGYLGILPRSLTSTHAFYVNTTVLADAGLTAAKTYDELKAQVPILRSKGYETIILGNQDGWVMQECLFSLIAGRFCGEAWEQAILSGKAKFTDSDFTAALEFIQSLYTDKVIARTTLLIDYGDVVTQFAENKAAYLIDGDWRARAFIPLERQEDILVTLFPEISGVRFNDSSSVIPGAGWGISANIRNKSPEERAAWRLIQWLSGRETQTRLLSTGEIGIPSRIDIDESALDLEPLQKEVAKFAREYKTGTAVIDRVFPEAVYSSINDGLQEIAMGTKNPGDVSFTAQNALDAWRAKQ
ncbi:extracellular solute-binding protein [Treponema primitia]|uniref:extracellular solute-binding protein n=1 Tax=Treponema primitia TaxID=88058 RepID=UPI000255590C|nr:extracellular solute-binding protein [Treponema primitia]